MKNRKGMTLIELLLAMSIFSIVILVLSAVFWRTYKTYVIETTNGQQQLSVRSTLDRINRETRQAVSVVDSTTSSGTTYTTSSNTLVLQLASVNSSQVIIPSTYDYIIYRTDPSDSTKLQEIIIAATGSVRKTHTRAILKNFSALTLTYYNSSNTAITSTYGNTKLVKISLKVSQKYYKTAGKNEMLTYTSQVSLRNK